MEVKKVSLICQTIRKTMCIAIIATLTSCNSFAQNPAISTKYTNKEIANLVQNYEKSNHRDIWAEGILLQKFQKDFLNAYSVEWETNDEICEVEFEIKDRDFKAYYDKDGNLLMYKQEIREGELPAAVKKSAKTKYPQHRFEDLEKIVKGTQTFYKVEMEYKEMEITMFLASNGEKFDY
jgi:hypothetical protein